MSPSWFQTSGLGTNAGGEGPDLTPPRSSATGKLSSRLLALKTGMLLARHLALHLLGDMVEDLEHADDTVNGGHQHLVCPLTARKQMKITVPLNFPS